jgi:hypothetical protein
MVEDVAMQVPPQPGASDLVAALSRLPPRASQLLGYRILEARPASECARLYGTNERAIAIHVFRAARLLRATLSSHGRRALLPSGEAVLPADEELGRATALAEALDASVERDDLSALLLRARALAPEIRRISEAQARAEAASPSRRRIEWLRRLAIGAFVLLAVWLYARGRW